MTSSDSAGRPAIDPIRSDVPAPVRKPAGSAPGAFEPRLLLTCLAAVLAASCAHQPDGDAMARAKPSADAALHAAAERVVLDPAAFEAARARTPAPARAEPAPAPVKAAPAYKQVLSVPFGVGATRLGAEQTGALQQLGRQAERSTRWRVTARIDSAGAPANNLRLARLRADRVTEALVRAGVAREAITLMEVQAGPAEAGDPSQARRVDVEAIEG